MITNKNIPLENPLSLELDINNLLLLNINYKEKEVNGVIHRDSTYLIQKEESMINKLINNCSEEEKIFEFGETELYKDLILDRNENLGEDDEDLDTLIKNMQQANELIEKKIMKLDKEIFIKKSLLPSNNEGFHINQEDIEFITRINELLAEFVNEKNKNLNL